MKVFVTGGSGFVGRHMIQMLCDRGDEVIALARSERSAEQVTQLGAKAVRGDLLDELIMTQAMQGCDTGLFHSRRRGRQSDKLKLNRVYKINCGNSKNSLPLDYRELLQ